MADDVAITAGAGTNIATDDDGSRHYQWIKIAWGPNDTFTKVDTASGKPLPVQLRSSGGVELGLLEDAAAVSGDPGIMSLAKRGDTPGNTSDTDGDYEPLQVSGGLLWVRDTQKFVTVSTDVARPGDTTAYTANDAFSDSTSAPTTGGFTFTNAARISGGSGIITDAIITTAADAATKMQGEIWLFDSAVTRIDDNAAFAVSDAEIKTYVGKIPFTFEDAGNNGSFHATRLNIGFTCVGSANLRYLIKVINGYTPISSEVLTARLKILQLD